MEIIFIGWINSIQGKNSLTWAVPEIRYMESRRQVSIPLLPLISAYVLTKLYELHYCISDTTHSLLLLQDTVKSIHLSESFRNVIQGIDHHTGAIEVK
jgi:hypothetical protein